ncbi:MAG: hypothetical protein ACYS7Y_29265 [Planctomycetota bacterium]|jgi:hypothetical protein
MELMELAKNFGPLAGVVLFFIWRDWRREEGLVDRVKHLEDFNTEILTNMVKENAAVIATNTEQLRIMNAQLQERRDG